MTQSRTTHWKNRRERFNWLKPQPMPLPKRATTKQEMTAIVAILVIMVSVMMLWLATAVKYHDKEMNDAWNKDHAHESRVISQQ